MKTSEEMVKSLLARRDAYDARRRQQKKTAMRIAIAACAFVLVAAVGVGLWQGGAFNPESLPVIPPDGADTTTADAPESTDGFGGNVPATTVQPSKSETEKPTETTVDTTATTTATTVQPSTTETEKLTETTVDTTATTATTVRPSTTETEKPTEPTKTKKTTVSVPSTTASTTANIATHPTAVGGTPVKEMGLNKVSVFQEMTLEELEAHYGQAAISSWLPKWLPERMDKRSGMPLGIYKKDETLISQNEIVWNSLLDSGVARDADVIYDCNQFQWTDFIDGRRDLTIGISTAPYPQYKLGDINRFDESVKVENTTVKVAYFEDSADCWCRSALFRLGKTEYYVEGWNLTEKEFETILKGLIQ